MSFSSGLRGIMSAHITYPKVIADGKPATLSSPFLTGILRHELGFKVCATRIEGAEIHWEVGGA